MPATSTTIPSAIAELKAALEAVDAEVWGARKPDITIGRRESTGPEAVILGVVNGDGQEWTALGAKSRDERYALDLYVLGIFPGLTPDEATARAWEIWAVVEATVVASVTGGTFGQTYNAEMRNPRGVPTEEPEGAGYVIESAVRFSARVRS